MLIDEMIDLVINPILSLYDSNISQIGRALHAATVNISMNLNLFFTIIYNISLHILEFKYIPRDT